MKQQLRSLLRKTEQATERLLHQEVNLAVTGFSGAGKSTFITSLINQLLYVNKYRNLPFWSVVEDGRFIASSLEELADRKVRRFDFSNNRQNLINREWPASTETTSGLSVHIKYRTSNRLLSSVKESLTLKLNIFDYPGEWLLDLVILKQSYPEWCRYAEKLLQQDDSIYNCWRQKLDAESFKVSSITDLSKAFAKKLKSLKSKGFLVSPGRFVLPGDLDGAPILEFFPLPEDFLKRNDESSGELIKILTERFEDFKHNVVKEFFDSYFKSIDRQIMLVDCIQLLKLRDSDCEVVAEAIEELSSIFCYGESNALKRIWSPKIDKVLFAATKSDQVPSDQQHRLQSFIESLFYPTHNKLKFRNTQVSFLTLSSVKCTESLVAEINGEQLHCIKGTLSENGEDMVVFPGLLPDTIESIHNSDYDLPEYLPPLLRGQEIPHIRMGKLLEFIVGDLFL